MPQLVLEFSANILERDNINAVFPLCHAALTQGLPTNLASCKSRAMEHSIYCVGDGQVHNAFIHVALSVMPGRSDETLNKVGEHIMAILRNHFSESMTKLQLQISLEIKDLEKNYFKEVS